MVIIINYVVSHTMCCLYSQSDLVGSIDAVKGAAKKALAAQEQTLEHNDQTAASLQGIKQVSNAVLELPPKLFASHCMVPSVLLKSSYPINKQYTSIITTCSFHAQHFLHAISYSV